MTVIIAHEEFIRECTDGMLKLRSERTIKNYQNTLKRFLDWFPVGGVDQINEGVVRQFFNRGETKCGWTASTIMTYRKNLAPFFDWCVRKEYLEKSPLDKIPTRTVLQQIPECYTEEELEKILYTVSMHAQTDFERNRNMAIFATLILTGLRKGELISLKVRDVDFENHTIKVRAEAAKNRRPRTVPMSYRLIEILEKYWEARKKWGVETYSFWVSSNRNCGLTEHGLKKLVARITKLSGVKITPHKFRHTFATNYYRDSKDVVGLQRLLGHKKVTTTMIYTQIDSDDLRASVEKSLLNNLF